MKIHQFALVALLSQLEGSLAFVPHGVGRTTDSVRRSMVGESVDLSIPYDAAARLAYDEWRTTYGKGDFDPTRYENFKNNYETITVANIVAKKKARDEGGSEPTLLTLNEYGDYTEEEYVKIMQSGGASTTGKSDVLSKAMEAAESQAEASSALGEAANALAEDEQVSFGWSCDDRSRDTCLRRCHLTVVHIHRLSQGIGRKVGSRQCGGVGVCHRFHRGHCRRRRRDGEHCTRGSYAIGIFGMVQAVWQGAR